MAEKVQHEARDRDDAESDLVREPFSDFFRYRYREGNACHRDDEKRDHGIRSPAFLVKNVLEIIHENSLKEIDRDDVEGVDEQKNDIRPIFENGKIGSEKTFARDICLVVRGLADREERDERGHDHYRAHDETRRGKTRRAIGKLETIGSTMAAPRIVPTIAKPNLKPLRLVLSL